MTSIRRRLLFAAAAVLIAVSVVSATLLAVDVYLHGRYEKSGGFNVWGYRGARVGEKKAGEYRIVMLGGSSAYGYGVEADAAIPAALQRMLREKYRTPLFTVVNLGYNNEGAYSFKTTLQDYEWLDYDLAILYEGYNDMGERLNLQVFRHDSPVFRVTGYMPIFPIIFKEKAAAMVNGGDPGALYREGQDQKTVFNANLATRASAGLLMTTADVAKALEDQLGKVAKEPTHRVDTSTATACSELWNAYCQSMSSAIRYAKSRGTQVLVGTQPYLHIRQDIYERHLDQQNELRGMLSRQFKDDAAVGYVNLGDRVNLEDPTLSFDHMHLTEEGNRRAAAAFVQPVLAMAARQQKN